MNVKTKVRMDFTEGALLKKMFFFAIPMILSTFLLLLFNAVDVAVVGKFADTIYQSAVGATSSSIHLIVNLVIGISIGANVAMATAFGAKDEEMQSRVVHTSMALSSVGGFAIAIFGILVTKPLLVALDTPDEVLPYAVMYMQIYFLGTPANVIYNFGAALFRAIGETKKPLAYLFVSGVINVAINIVTVVFLDMHVIGVALGTIVSQYVAAAWVVYDLIKEKSAARYEVKKTKFHKKELLKILYLGIPTGINSAMFSVANLLMQSAINSYGPIVMAGNTVSVNIDGFVDAFSASFGNVTLTVIGQNVGAKKIERIRKSMGAGALLCVISQLLCGVFILLFGRVLFALYNSDLEVIKIAQKRSYFTSAAYFLVVGISIFQAGLRGTGYSTTPMLVNFVFTCLFRILWMTFVYPLKPCLEMIFVLYPITWITAGGCMAVLFFLFEKRFKKKFLEKTQALTSTEVSENSGNGVSQA